MRRSGPKHAARQAYRGIPSIMFPLCVDRAPQSMGLKNLTQNPSTLRNVHLLTSHQEFSFDSFPLFDSVRAGLDRRSLDLCGSRVALVIVFGLVIVSEAAKKAR